MAKVDTYWDTLPSSYHYGETFDTRHIVDTIINDKVESVFECSVGSGSLITLLRKYGFKGDYLGSDYCNVFLNHAIKNNPREAFIEADLSTTINVPDKTYDVVVVRHGLEYVYPYDTALAEMKRIAKKYVIIDLWIPFANVTQIRFTEEGGWNVNYYDRKEFYDTIEKLGYTIIEDEAKDWGDGRVYRVMKLGV